MSLSEKKTILIGVAWPYANNHLHIGHIAGVYLPADIFARYQRLRKQKVLMVSGSDTHGTPVTITAREQKESPLKVVEKYHESFLKTFQKLGISFDWFTHTHTELHWETAQDVFCQLLKKNYIFKDTCRQLYDSQAKQFLADRHVEGTCPFCSFKTARGDQCDRCGKSYDAIELKEPRSKLTGHSHLEIRMTEHFFLNLPKLSKNLDKWLSQEKDHWRSHVVRFSRSLLDFELKSRAISRDIDWGIPLPLEEYQDKVLYVWFEAVIGYLSAGKEWAKQQSESDIWKDWWDNSDTSVCTYYFMGKDNIVFHTVIWPSMLLGLGNLALPYHVVASEYLNVCGKKLSKSRGSMIAMNDVLQSFETDIWRYALTAMAPENSDTNFTWEDFIHKVNGELIAHWGNLVHRVFTLTFRHFSGAIPKPEGFTTKDEELFQVLREGFVQASEYYDQVKLKFACELLRHLSQKVNQYLNDSAPWTQIKVDRKRAATVLYVALQAIDWLKTLWSPILCHSCERLHRMFGYSDSLFGELGTKLLEDKMGIHRVLYYKSPEYSSEIWVLKILPVAQKLQEPKALFKKLDPKDIDDTLE